MNPSRAFRRDLPGSRTTRDDHGTFEEADVTGRLSRVLLGVCGIVLAGCTVSNGTSPASSTAAVAPASRVVAAPQSESEQSYQAAIAAAQVAVAAQVKATDPEQLRQLAVTWESAPISGEPLAIARLEWSDAYLKALQKAQPAIASYQAQQAEQQATEQHCFDLAHTLVPGTDQASAQEADKVRVACDNEFGVP